MEATEKVTVTIRVPVCIREKVDKLSRDGRSKSWHWAKAMELYEVSDSLLGPK